ncbi:MAG: dienelactone hydrolase family protein [Myxococcales bacterium]|nr:dienelactone hydrolase family protein [Myxococcales bacterium]
MSLLSCLEHTPGGPVRGTVIWLHGLGASGYDFAPLVPHLGLTDVRYVFPHAPEAPVTINQGYVMPSWYDIRSLDHAASDREDPAGVRASAEHVHALIAREKERGVAHDRIVLAGFSQGAAMTLHIALRVEQPLLGAMVMSGYLVLGDTVKAEATEAGGKAPFLFAHGSADDVVPMAGGRAAYEMVTARGIQASWNDYRMGHEVNAEEVRDIRAFLHARFGSL